MPSNPPLPPSLNEDFVHWMASSPSCRDEIKANVAPLSFSESNIRPVAAMDDNERGSCVALAVKEMEVIDKADADAVLVASLASKLHVE